MTEKFGGRYERTEVSFAGGSGTVYICNDPRLQRLVAIKFLGPHREKRRMQDEIRALQTVRSKNVVEIFDIVIEPGNNVGIVQEYVDGLSMSDEGARPQDTQRYLRLIYQVASGVADIHAAGIIHRDLKPNNMRLTAGEIVKILDFDLARQTANAETFGFKGTPGYAAPELYQVNPTFTSAVDVFSLAASVAALTLRGSPVGSSQTSAADAGAWLALGGFANLAPALPPSVVALLNASLLQAPVGRPTAAAIRDAAAAELLTGRHRALLVARGAAYYCDAQTPRLQINGQDSMTIVYTGTAFRVEGVVGHVSINNVPATVGSLIRGSAVLGFGAANRPAYERGFMPLDVSHPEVVL